LGGNSLSDLLVFGRRAGLAAAAYANEAPSGAIDAQKIEAASRDMLASFERPAGESPYEIHRDLQETMQNYVGIFRNEEDLERGLAELQSLRERAARVRVEGSRLFNPGWHLAQDLRSMLTVSAAVALSARKRKESRGAHSRIDYPNYDEAWGTQNNIIVRDGDQMKLKQLPIAPLPDELRQLLK
jgi:succinate dehydrogenase / fumarate reductase flavoprotein subunit